MQSKNLHKALINICFDAKETSILWIVIESMYVELVVPIGSSKTHTSLEVDEKTQCLSIEIQIDSLSQLRAIVNSIIYLIHVVISTVKIISKYSTK